MSDHSESSVNASRRQFLSTAGIGVAGMAISSATGASATEASATGASATLASTKNNSVDHSRYRDSVVLITGATSGIGEATAHAYARQGAKVFFCGRREELGKEVEKAIREFGGEATYMRADVREEDQLAKFVSNCVEVYGGIDIAFNNAGIIGPLGGMDDFAVGGTGGYDDVIRTNVRGVYMAMRYELPVMRKAGKGVIVNTGSSLAHSGSPDMGAYAASKHAVIGLTRSAAAREAGNGIRIISVSPGGTRTNIFGTTTGERSLMVGGGGRMPMDRLAEPGEIAAVVLSVTAPECIFLNGDDVRADGASTAA